MTTQTSQNKVPPMFGNFSVNTGVMPGGGVTTNDVSQDAQKPSAKAEGPDELPSISQALRGIKMPGVG